MMLPNARTNVGIWVGTVRESVSERHVHGTHLHESAQTKNMTRMCVYSIFNDENIDRVVYPAGEEVDLATIEQHSHCQVTIVGWSYSNKRSTDRTNAMR